MLRRARKAGTVAKTLGGRWVVARASHELRHHSGLLKRQLPAAPWDAMPLASWLTEPALGEPAAYASWRRANDPGFFFESGDRAGSESVFARWDQEAGGPVEQADRIVEGTFRYFSHLDVALGAEPDWHRNAMTGEEAPADRHWTEIGDFGFGDIKAIWEPSRFGWAYDLVRAYWRTGDDRYPARFWQLLESWREANPPNLGPKWKCGQETSLRLMAWCFALYGFGGAEETTPERVATLAQMIAFSGKRVEANLGYALSQRNNHGVSEGMGLWTIGVLFPELRDAARWRDKGREVLERLARELIYDDGAFSQQSTNYHRVMLHDYLWSIRLGDVAAHPLSDELRERVGRAADLLYQLQDEVTGQVPNYGANDGALILPLTSCDYEDYRPVLQACRYLLAGVRIYAAGPWDEELWWLFGADALDARLEPPRRHSIATSSGYVTLRSEAGFAFTRAPEVFHDRPSHADVMHLDIWWRGINIAADAGTYSYNAPAPWNTGLGQTAVHNTVTVDGFDQMEKAGRFLWAPWLRASIDARTTSAGGCFEGVLMHQDGYTRLDDPVSHHRAVVRLGREHWLVVDWLHGTTAHRYRLHWLLEDLPYGPVAQGGGVVLQVPHGPYQVVCGTFFDAANTAEIERASVDDVSGWKSGRYLERAPAISLSSMVTGDTTMFWTVLGPETFDVGVEGATLSISVPEGVVTGAVHVSPPSLELSVSGAMQGDRMDLISSWRE